ncbi:MAG: HAD hydrolase-like protein [Syntrophotaleaceae bacterium]
MIHNVLFDLDGTLTDPKEGITRCIQFSLTRLGRKAPSEEDLLWCIGPPLKDSFGQLLESNETGLLELALRHYRERYSEIGIYENNVFPDIVPTLRKIRESGFRLFLATSKPEVFAIRVLDHFDLTQFFHGIHGSELDGSLCEKADLVAHIIKTWNLDPCVTLIVGDRVHDVIGGKRNGIKTGIVSYGYGTRGEIEAAASDFVFESPSELVMFLKARETEKVSRLNF